jgi:hypothetical protein
LVDSVSRLPARNGQTGPTWASGSSPNVAEKRIFGM